MKTTWNIVHDADDEGGNPALWSLALGNERFLWIETAANGTFQIIDTNAERILKPNFKTLASAKRYVTTHILPNLGDRGTGVRCIKGYEITAMSGGCGWYLGTYDEDGYPNCCITTGHAKTMADAKNLPLDRQRATENVFCNGCGKCFSSSSH